MKSIDEFVKDDRLFRYAMKAHGLEDMAYAKAFMVKALKEGLADPDSFANKLTDKRYAEFVKTFNFAAHGEVATVYNKAQHEVPKNYAIQAAIAGVDPNSEFVRNETDFYLANIGKVKSVDEFMANERLLTYAMAAYGLDSVTENMDFIEELLEGGTRDPESPANKQTDKRYTAFVAAFDFEGHGEVGDHLLAGAAPGDRQIHAPDAGGECRRRRMKACGWRSISSARPAASRPSTTFSPIRPSPRSCAPRSACRTASLPPTSTAR